MISIIIPVYNQEKYIEECLKSVISQTYNNIEILVIDDGSTDRSLRICKKFQKIDSRIKVFSIENGGVSRARNYGLKKATGEWVTFVDSDDIISTDYCKELIANTDAKTDMIIARTLSFLHDDITKIADDKYRGGHCDIFLCSREKHELYKSILIDNRKITKYPHIATCSAKLFSLKLINNNKLMFNESLKVYEDALFNMEAIEKSRQVKVVNSIIYYYRENYKSITRNISLDEKNQYVLVEKEFRRFFELTDFIFDDYVSYFRIKNLNTMLSNHFKSKSNNNEISNEIIVGYMQDFRNVKYSWLPKRRKLLKLLARNRLYRLVRYIY